jgi:hypothetical protein
MHAGASECLMFSHHALFLDEVEEDEHRGKVEICGRVFPRSYFHVNK